MSKLVQLLIIVLVIQGILSCITEKIYRKTEITSIKFKSSFKRYWLESHPWLAVFSMLLVSIYITIL